MSAGRRNSVALLVLLASGGGATYATAAGASGGSPSVRPPTIYYRKPKPNASNIAGRLTGGRSGVRVVLEARRWPFNGPFKSMSSERTGSGGAFNFVQRPSLATQYRVSSQGSTSGIRTLFVYPGFENAVCTWSGGHSHGSCTQPPVKPGSYTMHFSFDYLYPPAVFSQEAALPVYAYFGECFGCSAPPSTLHRQGTVSQTRSGPNSTHVSISQGFSVRSGQKYQWYLAPCIQTTERSNGFGLPGRPGSHRCGKASVLSKYFRHGRDLG